MKKVLKAIVCILIIAFTLLGFVAKYDTLGIYPFQPIRHEPFREAIDAAGSRALGSSPDYLYKNNFGRTVFMLTARDEVHMSINHSHTGIAPELCQICNPPPNRAVCLYTVSPGFTTHFDFFNLANSPKPFTTILKKAGMPITASKSSLNFFFETADGYRYYVHPVHSSGLSRLVSVVAPDGTKLTSAQISSLTQKICLVYLGAAAALSAVLFLLLKLNRHLHQNVPSFHRPVNKRKLFAIVVCILLFAGFGLRSAANSDYYGLISSTNINWHIPYHWNTQPDYSKALQTGVLTNHFGKTAVFTSHSVGDQTYCIPSGTYTPKPQFHISALSVCTGDSTTRVFSILGIPDKFKGSVGNQTLIYCMPLGYTYEFSTKWNAKLCVPTVTGWTITAPDGTELDAAAFQWQVRLTCLTIAAGLGILAAALAIPNHIRKRKASV